VRLAARRQILRRGAIVHVPAGAHATLICSTETLVSLAGQQDWKLSPKACGQGLPLPESSYRNLTSYAGRILPRNGILLLELETRNADARLGPTLLSPRNTAVMDPYPLLVWSQVPDAVEYEIEIRGGSVEMSIRLTADEAHCGHGSGLWQDLEVCSWKPAEQWPALEPEKVVFLRLGSRRAATAPLQQGRELDQIRLLSASEQRSIHESLLRIDPLPIDPVSRLLLAAGAYAQAGLNADAVAAYEQALQAQEVPEARVTLGDLYLASGLASRAEREYRQVLADAPDPAAQAAAEVGLGCVAYFRKRYHDSQEHFEHAQEIYNSLGLTEEAEDARAAAARAQG
jgi:hypothetical protein